ncbi:MAG: hypothetical protein CM15mP120_04190 [Pseudomonadota bacterium]|nr:MAG: hypothetical protein CM15mP120_04190 [Pseudomonadota bacterium]
MECADRNQHTRHRGNGCGTDPVCHGSGVTGAQRRHDVEDLNHPRTVPKSPRNGSKAIKVGIVFSITHHQTFNL